MEPAGEDWMCERKVGIDDAKDMSEDIVGAVGVYCVIGCALIPLQGVGLSATVPAGVESIGISRAPFIS